MSRWESFRKGKSCAPEGLLCDYHVYTLSWKEWGRYLAEGVFACGMTAYVFYRSAALFLFLLPAGLFHPIRKRNFLAERRREELRLQFKEGILMLASSLAAGYSVENAFAASARDLRELYGETGMITEEFDAIVEGLRMNRTVESLLMDFAGRSGLEEVESFAEIFAVSKRSRGELVSVVNHVAHVIGDRIQVREEIRTMTAEKQFEQKIMNLMPYLIVLYVDFSSPGFFSPMYETIAGRIVMTACLVIYLAACYLSGKILKMEV